MDQNSITCFDKGKALGEVQLMCMHFNKVWSDVYCLMTPGLSKDIQCHVGPVSINLQITKSDIRSHRKWTVSLVISCVHFNFLKGLCGYTWVNTLTLSRRKGFQRWGDMGNMHVIIYQILLTFLLFMLVHMFIFSN